MDAPFTPSLPPLSVVAACALTDPGPLTLEARRAQQRMSRAAFLAERALRRLMSALPALSPPDPLAPPSPQAPADPQAPPDPSDRARVGCFLGVGGCGGDVPQFERIMSASVRDGRWSQPDFNGAGLKACNPLYAFQLMHNFTLCHGAITEGLGGPNAALYGHGAGAWWALLEAAAAVTEGTCALAIAGGADDARHPIADPTRAPPSEAAALLALALPPPTTTSTTSTPPPSSRRPRALLTGLWAAPVATLHQQPAWADPALRAEGVLSLTWSPDLPPPPHHLDLTASLGDALAATPALLWVAALDTLATSAHTHTAHALFLAADATAYGVTFQRPPT